MDTGNFTSKRSRTGAMRPYDLWFAISVAWLCVLLGAAVYVFVI